MQTCFTNKVFAYNFNGITVEYNIVTESDSKNTWHHFVKGPWAVVEEYDYSVRDSTRTLCRYLYFK